MGNKTDRNIGNTFAGDVDDRSRGWAKNDQSRASVDADSSRTRSRVGLTVCSSIASWERSAVKPSLPFIAPGEHVPI